MSYRFHVNALGVSPLMSEIFVQLLSSGLGNFVKTNEVFDDPQVTMKA